MMRTCKRLWSAVTVPGDWIPRSREKAYAPLSLGLLSALAIHISVLVLFYHQGVAEMVWFNLLSLLIYSFAWYLNYRGFPRIPLVLGSMELCLHQVLSVHLVGLDAGFQYYLGIIPALISYLPGRRWGMQVVWVLVPGLTYLFLQSYGASHAPEYALSPGLLEVLRTLNISMLFILLGFFASNYVRSVEAVESQLEAERQRSEALLHNILPAQIAERLKRSKGVIADGFQDSSILFADIVGFSPLSQQRTPSEVVMLLNQIFTEFDRLVVKYGLEKIKTIGDAYMVASGIPEPRPDALEVMADLALEMLRQAKITGQALGIPLQIRIGLNAGPVVAGVIGTQKYIYDLWGDSVNTAARMESHGLPGEIQVPRSVYERLRIRYRLEPRGVIPVKGLGDMEVFLLKSRRLDSTEPRLQRPKAGFQQGEGSAE